MAATLKPRTPAEAAFLAELLGNEANMSEAARKRSDFREQAIAARNERANELNRLTA
jgi:hypothetical protein